MPPSKPSKELPRHIAIIMDGNGRWPKRRNLPRLDGHKQGADSVREVVRACREIGIKALTLYAFSAQNWDSPARRGARADELLRDYLVGERQEILDNHIRLMTIGDESRLPAFVRQPLDALKADSAANRGMTLCLALSYGGREAILDACRRLVDEVRDGRMRKQDITLQSFSGALSTQGLPELDLVIRTSGEQRLSNFLLWEAAYAELYFHRHAVARLRRVELNSAISVFQSRERRFV